MQSSLAAMRLDIRLEYQDAVDASHHGRPVLVQQIPSDGPGRPRIHIDPDFLRWAYGHRSIAGISRFLRVGRTTVRNALLAEGIFEPQANPFPSQQDDASPVHDTDANMQDDILDPDLPIPQPGQFPDDVESLAAPTV